MKSLKASLVIFLITSSTQAIVLRNSPTLMILLEHMSMYKLTTPKFHAGNLLHHSLWTCRTLGQWFDENKLWINGLEKHKLIIMLGGLFHDIGKAGDGNYFYDKKPTHPCNGFALLMLKQPFLLENGLSLNINNIYKELEITLEEQRFLAVLVGMHWEFGLIMKNMNSKVQTTLKQECLTYLKKLQVFCQQANLGYPSETLLKGCIAVSAADVRGIQPNTYSNATLTTLLGNHFIEGYQRPCYTGFDGYTIFKTEKDGLPIRTKLCKMLLKKKRPQVKS